MAKPRLLVTGGSGFIGSRLVRDLSVKWDVVSTCGKQPPGPGMIRVDLTDAADLERAFHEAAPRAVVHTAAMAEPDACEKQPELAGRVNRDAAQGLARLCAKAGARFVHFSTDLVFDGLRGWYREQDAPHPLSVYGRTKLESEHAALEACPGAAVLRVATVYGRAYGGRPSFLDTLRQRLSQGQRVQAFTDQWRTATANAQISEAVAALLERSDISGIFHWTGATRASRWEFASAFCRIFGFSESLVEAARMEDMRLAAPRPRDTSLDSTGLARLLKIAPWSLEDGLRRARGEWEPVSAD
ncbi:MAG TPA: hypothetical protein DEB40_01715 [Elusimicrobia bacterium]|nr:hypothetical protein [Elusimicrobiota bacterium]HBT60447.1 hypothetical protein [Elusimicrobiota bacterium]